MLFIIYRPHPHPIRGVLAPYILRSFSAYRYFWAKNVRSKYGPDTWKMRCKYTSFQV